jgi:hypothetical protein
VLIPVMVLLGGYFLVRDRDWRPAAYLIAALAGANLTYRAAKSWLAGRGPRCRSI